LKNTLLLARTFFQRFFESDLMPPGLPQAQLVIWSMALLASPGLLLPTRFAYKYSVIYRNQEALAQALVVDRLVFITLTMTALGFVALVIWDGVFPDRRDARILSVLPVPGWVLIVARLAALCALAGVLLLGITAVPTVFYGPVVARFGGATNPIRGAVAHFLATTAAGTFVFCALVTLQGIVLNVGGRRAADRVSLVLQVVFVVALLQMVLFLPRMLSIIPDLATVAQNPWLRAMPSLWFVGLYDVLGGRPQIGAGALATVAVAATGLAASAAIALCALTHGRLTRLALESRDASVSQWRWIVATIAKVTRVLCPSPIGRAAFEFTLRTLARSRSHRLLMATYVGVALAFAGSAIIPLVLRRGLAGFAEPGVELLATPLIISFLTLVGMRVAIAIPVEPKANWIVRLHEPGDSVRAINGVRMAMLCVGVVPTALLAAASSGILWGGWPAFVHAVVVALMGWMLLEILLIGFEKIPFTCTYYPGKSRIRTLWPFYLNAFFLYTFTTAAGVLEFLVSWRALAVFVVMSLGIIVGLTTRRRYRLRGMTGFRFQEEDPDSLFAGFNFSESFAAQSGGQISTFPPASDPTRARK
jgi:hypothetical protein